MVCLSRPLLYITKQGGEAVWKEVTFHSLPKDRMRSPTGIWPYFLFPFTGVSLYVYASMQAEFNPKSYVATWYKKISDFMTSENETTVFVESTNKHQRNLTKLFELDRFKGVEKVMEEEEFKALPPEEKMRLQAEFGEKKQIAKTQQLVIDRSSRSLGS